MLREDAPDLLLVDADATAPAIDARDVLDVDEGIVDIVELAKDVVGVVDLILEDVGVADVLTVVEVVDAFLVVVVDGVTSAAAHSCVLVAKTKSAIIDLYI